MDKRQLLLKTAVGELPKNTVGQRKDGAIILLVIDGRQANSIGATFQRSTRCVITNMELIMLVI